MRLVSLQELRAAVTVEAAVAAVEEAFAALARGEARLPPPVNLEIPESAGEVHVKGGHLRGAPFYAFKVATGFYRNAGLGLPTGSGMVIVGDARTGLPVALLLDDGWLTDLRTGAAGAVAVRHLAKPGPLTVGVIGTGVQARLQLRCLAAVREIAGVAIWGRSSERAAACAQELAGELGAPVRTVATAAEAARGAAVLFTVTPSREPIVRTGWIDPGTLVVAVGADGPEKRELDPGVLAAANRVVADHLNQCLRLGEIHHAVDAGVLRVDAIVELGDIILGLAPGRRSPAERIVCDLTGVGVQDAAIAGVAMRALGLDTATAPAGALLP